MKIEIDTKSYKAMQLIFLYKAFFLSEFYYLIFFPLPIHIFIEIKKIPFLHQYVPNILSNVVFFPL